MVGGGTVAHRKVKELLKAQANVKVVSPELARPLQLLHNKGHFEYVARGYKKGDLAGAFLVIAATDDNELNSRIAEHFPNGPLNVVDAPDYCSFIVPSIMRRGPLVIAVSTSGTSPAMARAIRLDLERAYGPEFTSALQELKRKRKTAQQEIKDPAARMKYLKTLASPDTVKKLKRS